MPADLLLLVVLPTLLLHADPLLPGDVLPAELLLPALLHQSLLWLLGRRVLPPADVLLPGQLLLPALLLLMLGRLRMGMPVGDRWPTAAAQ